MKNRIFAYRFPPPIQTIRVDRVSRFEPLELEYLYTYLKGHEITILDGMENRRNVKSVVKRLQPHIIFLTGYLIHLPGISSFARWAKTCLTPAPLIFVGGPQAEVTPELFCSPDLDGIVTSADPAIAVKIVEAIGEGTEYRGIPGVSWFSGGRFFHTPQVDFDPSGLLKPDRVLFNARPERYFNMFYRPCASLKTAYGCPGRCSFCFCKEMNGGRYACRNILAVLDELQELASPNVFILDDNFLVSAERLQDFVDGIRERNIRKRFIVYGTSDFIVRHADLMKSLSEVGVRWIIIGFEYISQADLERVKKRATDDDNLRALEICRSMGIEVTALFMVDPAWRAVDFDALEAYVRTHGLFFATYSTRTVFPGTEDGRLREWDGEEPWWRYDLLRLHEAPQNMSRWMFYVRLYRLYLLPVFDRMTFRKVISSAGWKEGLRLMFTGTLTGLEFLVKLFIFP